MRRDNPQVESTPIAFTVLDEIRKQLNDFTPRHRAFAEFVLQNPETLAFLTITDIAKEAGVSQTTIVRFCNGLGYDGYAQLVREARQTIQAEIGSAGRFKIIRRMRKDSKIKQFRSVFENLLEQELENMSKLAKHIKIAEFYRCIDFMAEADQICIIGCMSSAPMALISILVNAFGEQYPEKTEEGFLRYDKYSSKMNLYKISRSQLKSGKNN